MKVVASFTRNSTNNMFDRWEFCQNISSQRIVTPPQAAALYRKLSRYSIDSITIEKDPKIQWPDIIVTILTSMRKKVIFSIDVHGNISE